MTGTETRDTLLTVYNFVNCHHSDTEEKRREERIFSCLN